MADELVLAAASDDIRHALEAMEDDAVMDILAQPESMDLVEAWMTKVQAGADPDAARGNDDDVLECVMDTHVKRNLKTALSAATVDLAWLRPKDPLFARQLLSRSQGAGDTESLASGPHVWFIKRALELIDVVRVLLKVPSSVTVETHEEKSFQALDLVLQLTHWLWALNPTKLSTLIHGDILELTSELLLATCSAHNASHIEAWCRRLLAAIETNVHRHETSKIRRLVTDVQDLLVHVKQDTTPFHAALHVPRISAPVLQALDMGILAHYNETRVDANDEALRRRVVDDLQKVVKSSFDRKCGLHLYGSSLSLFGSKGCDIDITAVRRTPNSPAAHSGIGAARRQHDDALKAMGLAARCAEALDQIKGDAAKALAAYTKIKSRCPADMAKTPAKIANQLQQAHVFLRAANSLVTMTELMLPSKSSPASPSLAATKKQIHLAIQDADIQRKAMYRLSGALQRGGCTVEQLILGARVPIIKFLHTGSGLEGDICMGNLLPTKNTLLLRTYGEYDPRVRPLVLAVKHWAKARRINDASMGTLSSYSYVLLVIHVLQEAGVLPNLQDPGLLQKLGVPSEELNGCNVAFCQNVARVKAVVSLPDTQSLSVASLLVRFFLYLKHFDWYGRSVAIHRSELLTKQERWGAKRKAWRMSIEDPFELDRDLGVVLQLGGQQKILEEVDRAVRLIVGEDATFETLTAVLPKPLTKKEKKDVDKATRQEKRKPKKKADNTDKLASKTTDEAKQHETPDGTKTAKGPKNAKKAKSTEPMAATNDEAVTTAAEKPLSAKKPRKAKVTRKATSDDSKPPRESEAPTPPVGARERHEGVDTAPPPAPSDSAKSKTRSRRGKKKSKTGDVAPTATS
ncbi:hypothetical protein SPRG_18864 [Saprolegnia parasitica CBS 223.65]|uniref:Poly(A) RNA polymerase mitochondrial-like central palm domain-containing protein n=1 Tax=Saprolegnia parasitica (strain CBS 223.65) TaxID=695850 RepID=A0A067DAT6_SAPPC|nr:hypothetical protein SPRG_18864 [Saprolegnia parasitica CBS 223.65]KDO35716.1 hypothetical protein SPRG_18864 [Saprolegnia parasitica CBS 223.65]|eukprot:XP_012194080.1 hypothetical protein SPRG_18864 [Saprolegnia parasitica CBS 223.65]